MRGRQSEIQNPSMYFSIRSSLSVFMSILIVTERANGHLASFISSDGKPNMTPRPIRGPTVPNLPFDVDSNVRALLRVPSYGHGKQLYFRNMDDKSFANVNTMGGVSTSEIKLPHHSYDYYGDHKPTFVPVIGPRVLTSVTEYLKHLRENLEALQSMEDDPDDYVEYDADENDSNENDAKNRHQTRRHVNPVQQYPNHNTEKFHIAHQQLPRHARYHHHSSSNYDLPHNTRRFVDPPIYPDMFIRRAAPNNYNPSWSYTKLGLGKRGRR